MTIILDYSARARPVRDFNAMGEPSFPAAPPLQYELPWALRLGTGQLELQNCTQDIVRQVDDAVEIEVEQRAPIRIV